MKALDDVAGAFVVFLVESGYSREEIARRTGFSRSKVHRLVKQGHEAWLRQQLNGLGQTKKSR